MKLLSIFLFTSLYAFNANASYIERCIFQTKVLNKTAVAEVDDQAHTGDLKPVVVVEILNSRDLGSHHELACASNVGKLKVLALSREDLALVRLGRELVLKYSFVNSVTPSGFSSYTTWTLVK